MAATRQREGTASLRYRMVSPAISRQGKKPSIPAAARARESQRIRPAGSAPSNAAGKYQRKGMPQARPTIPSNRKYPGKLKRSDAQVPAVEGFRKGKCDSNAGTTRR